MFYSRRQILSLAAVGTAGMLASPLALATARGHVGPRARRLRLFNLHTHEAFECALEPGEMPARELLKTFDFFMRDHYCGRVGNMDPSLIEHMMTLTEALEAPGEMIHVISAYRAPATNRMLQERGKKVAQHSLHLTGQAIDIRMPDVALRDIRDAALDLRVGGVGYYRKSNFLHFDTGRIRRW